MTEPARRARHLSVVHPGTDPVDLEEAAPLAGVPAEVPAVETVSAGMRYGDRWALRDCSLSIPQGSVVAVVGRNGAGKTTLLQMIVGLTRPGAGVVRIAGRPSWPAGADLLSRIGFVAQDKPLYRSLRVADMIRLGGRLNPQWDHQYAISRLADRDVPLRARIGKLSGGQRTQVALVMALAKRPSLLVLDEPLSDLDPLARREVLGALMVDLAERDVTVVLSSHVLADLTRVCDWLVVIDSAMVRLSDPIDVLLAGHRQLVGPTELVENIRRRYEVVSESSTGRQAVLLVRGEVKDLVADGRWDVRMPTLEDLVFAHMTSPAPTGS
jgi:ABC-2 type transport system ATP-binding protein